MLPDPRSTLRWHPNQWMPYAENGSGALCTGGAAGLMMADGVARLWGGAVVEHARGQGVYRALLAARLDYGAARGATMALVKARVQTSGPILRRAGFRSYGQELTYDVPLR